VSTGGTRTGGAGTGGGQALRDTLGARIAGASMTNKVFAAVGTRGRRVRRGTRFLFTLSEPAAVRVTIEQALAGRRVGTACRRPTAKLRSRKACKRYARRGSLSARGTQGANALPFGGKLQGRSLRPGTYRARISAADPAGNRSVNEPTLAFRIVRASGARSRSPVQRRQASRG
jgi:hypothetical protein